MVRMPPLESYRDHRDRACFNRVDQAIGKAMQQNVTCAVAVRTPGFGIPPETFERCFEIGQEPRTLSGSLPLVILEGSAQFPTGRGDEANVQRPSLVRNSSITRFAGTLSI